MKPTQKAIDASNALEELAIEMKDLVNEIREGDMGQMDAYARIYHLRRRLGYVVNTLGAGTPRTPQGPVMTNTENRMYS